MENFATPLNTTGMGSVNMETDPISYNDTKDKKKNKTAMGGFEMNDSMMSMLGGYIYVPGRSIGKTETLNIFKEWKERPNKTPDAIYTYDMLMEGANINT